MAAMFDLNLMMGLEKNLEVKIEEDRSEEGSKTQHKELQVILRTAFPVL